MIIMEFLILICHLHIMDYLGAASIVITATPNLAPLHKEVTTEWIFHISLKNKGSHRSGHSMRKQ